LRRGTGVGQFPQSLFHGLHIESVHTHTMTAVNGQCDGFHIFRRYNAVSSNQGFA
jgi:hypothetical protein